MGGLQGRRHGPPAIRPARILPARGHTQSSVAQAGGWGMGRLFVGEFLRDESGPTAAEYAVILALIVMAVIGTVGAIGNTTSGVWGNDSSQIMSAVGS